MATFSRLARASRSDPIVVFFSIRKPELRGIFSIRTSNLFSHLRTFDDCDVIESTKVDVNVSVFNDKVCGDAVAEAVGLEVGRRTQRCWRIACNVSLKRIEENAGGRNGIRDAFVNRSEKSGSRRATERLTGSYDGSME